MKLGGRAEAVPRWIHIHPEKRWLLLAYTCGVRSLAWFFITTYQLRRSLNHCVLRHEIEHADASVHPLGRGIPSVAGKIQCWTPGSQVARLLSALPAETSSPSSDQLSRNTVMGRFVAAQTTPFVMQELIQLRNCVHRDVHGVAQGQANRIP